MTLSSFTSLARYALPTVLVLPAAAQSRPQLVYWDTLDSQGNLTGGQVMLDVPDRDAVYPRIPASVESFQQHLLPPDPNKRLDIVFVGDGYQAAQLGTYTTHVANIVASFFAIEPYLTYREYFSVHRVDVISADSGVDNDPTFGVARNTALNMRYWCDGIERLLCVDVGLAYSYAANAPQANLVAAIANSTKYGGAGYPTNDLATGAGSNAETIGIMQHEFGHALGDLADEYDYGGPATWTGGEVSMVNASIYPSAQMNTLQTKWHRWLGVNLPAFDGLVSTFQGANYSVNGIYRPTNNSMMRSLGRPFNLPAAEALIAEIYRFTDPVDSHSPTSTTYNGTETLFVVPMTKVGTQPLQVQWLLNGVAIPGATGNTLNLATLGLTACTSLIAARVVDPTTMVRDEGLRQGLLTQTINWLVVATQNPITTYCIAAPNSVGSGATISAAGSTSIALSNLQLTVTGLPPSSAGLYFHGSSTGQTPFGNGWRCGGGTIVRLPTMNANLFGDATLNFNPASAPAGVVVPGALRRFQYWYRNPAGGGAGFNLSNALSVQFCP